jgi:hypothetical protein
LVRVCGNEPAGNGGLFRFLALSSGDRRVVQHARAWLVTFVVLWSGWILLAGEWNHYEWIAATGAAAVAATVAEIARSRSGVSARLPGAWLRRGHSAFLQVFVDFGIVLCVLARSTLRGEAVRGEFHSHESDMAGNGAAAVGTRAWRTLLADYSPNAYVVDVDHETGAVLLHELVLRRSSEEPA